MRIGIRRGLVTKRMITSRFESNKSSPYISMPVRILKIMITGKRALILKGGFFSVVDESR